jgi:hypothetical protein
MTIAALAMMTVTACGGEDRAATVELPPSPTPEIEHRLDGRVVGTCRAIGR